MKIKNNKDRFEICSQVVIDFTNSLTTDDACLPGLAKCGLQCPCNRSGLMEGGVATRAPTRSLKTRHRSACHTTVDYQVDSNSLLICLRGY